MVLHSALSGVGSSRGHYVVVLSNTLYFHIATRDGLASYPGRSRDAPSDLMILKLKISSSLECRLNLSSLENSILPLLVGYEVISFIILSKHYHQVSVALLLFVVTCQHSSTL